MEKLYELLLSYELLGSVVLIYLSLYYIKKLFPSFWDGAVANKVLSDVLPEVLGVGFFVLLHVTKLHMYNWWEMVLGGLVAGYLSPKAYFIIQLLQKAITTFIPKKTEISLPEDPVKDEAPKEP